MPAWYSFYGIKSEGQEDKQEVLSSVEDTHQVPEAAVNSARQIIGEVEENVSPAENSVEKVVKKPEERTVEKSEERPVEKFVDKKQADKRQKVASKREAVAVPPVSSTDIKLASDVVNTPLKLEGTICDLVLSERKQDSKITAALPVHTVETVKREFDWKSDTLETKRGIDLLRIKMVGGFVVALMNYRFMPLKENGGLVRIFLWDYNSEDSKLLFTYLDDFDFEARTINVAPFIGYFFKDNQVVGVKLGYKHTDGHLGNVSFKIDDDVNFTLKELKLKEELYNCTFFHSSYIGLDPGKRFGLFNETNLRLGFGHSEFTRGSGESLKNTKTNIFEAQLGINPGVAVFIMQNVSVECSVGVIGLKYRKESQVNNLGEKGSRTNGGANFKINLFDINLGLTISM